MGIVVLVTAAVCAGFAIACFVDAFRRTVEFEEGFNRHAG